MSQANVSLLLRRDTAAHWESINPILKQGEPGYNLTTRELKIGDGIHTWTELRTIKCSDLICRTTAEWASDLNYVPARGTLLVYLDKYQVDENQFVPGLKIGDGTSYGIDLPFVGDNIARDLLDHISNATIHITGEEREFWNNKLNCSTEIVDETLTINRL